MCHDLIKFEGILKALKNYATYFWFFLHLNVSENKVDHQIDAYTQYGSVSTPPRFLYQFPKAIDKSYH